MSQLESATDAILSGTRKFASSPSGGTGRYLVATSGILANTMPAKVPITPRSAPRTKLRPAVQRRAMDQEVRATTSAFFISINGLILRLISVLVGQLHGLLQDFFCSECLQVTV